MSNDTHDGYMYAREAETMARDQLAALQLDKLKTMVRHADANFAGNALIIRGVNLYPSQVEAVLLGRARIAPHYQLIVAREGTMDTLGIDVEVSPGVPESDFNTIAADVRNALKTHVGVSSTVNVKPPGEVPRSEGKAVRVRDLRPKN